MKPAEKNELRLRLTFQRALCNWVWPLIILATAVYDIVSLIGGAELDWRWWLSVAWYVLAFRMWGSQIKELRALRTAYRESGR